MAGAPSPDLAVVGGGIIGLACARELARRGARVTLHERNGRGHAASWAAAGMLAPLSEVRQAGPLFEACRASRDQWEPWHRAVSAEAGIEAEYDRSGALVVAADDAEEAALDEMATAAGRLGEPVAEVPAAEARRLVPDLRPEVRRAILLAGEHRVDNVRFCEALGIAAERSGVEIRHHTEVTAIERHGRGLRLTTAAGAIEVAGAVLAGGAWSGRILGVEPLPVRPVRGQMLRLEGADWPWRGCVRVLGRYYGIRRAAAGLLIGATLEEAGFADHPTPAGIAFLLSIVERGFPGLRGAPLTGFWSGLRPGSPDDLPILGRYRDWPLWIASGHFRNGVLLAPWTARELTSWVLGEADEPAANAFRWSRLAA